MNLPLIIGLTLAVLAMAVLIVIWGYATAKPGDQIEGGGFVERKRPDDDL